MKISPFFLFVFWVVWTVLGFGFEAISGHHYQAEFHDDLLVGVVFGSLYVTSLVMGE